MINYQNRIVQEDMSTIVSQSYIQWDRMTNKSVMITGANGMLATYMVYVLAYLNETQNANIKIIATARNIEKAKARFSDLSKMSNFELIKHDVTENVNYESNVDYIVHAASNASPRFILEDPVGIINANVIGTLNMLKLAEATRATIQSAKTEGTRNRAIARKSPKVPRNSRCIVSIPFLTLTRTHVRF